jgi:hypothetical protein
MRIAKSAGRKKTVWAAVVALVLCFGLLMGGAFYPESALAASIAGPPCVHTGVPVY